MYNFYFIIVKMGNGIAAKKPLLSDYARISPRDVELGGFPVGWRKGRGWIMGGVGAGTNMGMGGGVALGGLGIIARDISWKTLSKNGKLLLYL